MENVLGGLWAPMSAGVMVNKSHDWTRLCVAQTAWVPMTVMGSGKLLQTQVKIPEGHITGPPEKVPLRSLRLPAPWHFILINIHTTITKQTNKQIKPQNVVLETKLVP